MMYSIPACGVQQGKDPSKGKASWGGTCDLSSVADCWWAELCYGLVQWRGGTWPLSDMKKRSLSSSDFLQLAWGRNKNGSVVLEAPPASELCGFSPHTLLPTYSANVCLLHKATVPSSTSSKHGNLLVMYSRSGLLCSTESCFLGEVPVTHVHGQGCWAGLPHGPQDTLWWTWQRLANAWWVSQCSLGAQELFSFWLKINNIK